MKRMRKSIVVLVVAAAGTVGMIGGASGAQASELPEPAPVVKIVRGGGEPLPPPQAMGSSWQ
jgi:hypothetical protein